MRDIRNVAIIAHVDHGKTTLLDQVLTFCSAVSNKEQQERVMDSNDLEKERGITIFSKNTAVEYKSSKINIVDTPGHSDFGGEVERVLNMVDACLLLVDAGEGPMPQTRFVLKKALALKHKIILILNKIDKPSADPDKAVEDTFELFLDLGASDEQIDFPVIYASAKEGYALKEWKQSDHPNEKKDMAYLLDCLLEHVPPAKGNQDQPFKFQVTALDYDDYIGRICIGRIFDGAVKSGDQLALWGKNGQGDAVRTEHKITKLFTFLGLHRVEVREAHTGDIVAIAGISEMTIGDTLTGLTEESLLPRIEIDPPTVSMQFRVNDSPFAGKEGKMLTSRQIKARLEKETMTNLSLQFEEIGDSFKVSGRGELHLAILIENMRREGFELSISKPKVILKKINDKSHEPFEEIILDMPEEYSGGVIQELNRRRGQVVQIENVSETYIRAKYVIPSRSLIGFRSFFLTETRGNGALSGIFLGYQEYIGDFAGRKRGAIVSMMTGGASTYGLFQAQNRGELHISPQTPVYEGMIIGLHAKETDLDVNPVKEKKLTNVRASGSDEALKLIPHKDLSLEESLDFLEEDEVLEVTPLSLRIRKKILKANMRKKLALPPKSGHSKLNN